MKNIFPIVLLVVGLLACKDDEEPQGPPPLELGEASLVLNDESLEFDALARSLVCSSNHLAISFSRFSKNFAKGTTFLVDHIPAKEGRYALRRSDADENCKLNIPSGSALAYGGETLIVTYDILEGKGSHELVITRYDSVAQRLEGHLQMTVVVKEKLLPIGKREYPDTLQITQGTFVTNIYPPDE